MQIELILVSLLAGVLTVLAPCVLPLLPIIISSSATSSKWVKPIIIIVSLCASILLFSLGLRTLFFSIGLKAETWNILGGMVTSIFGLSLVFPRLWSRILLLLKIEGKADKALAQTAGRKDVLAAILIGMLLGPILNSCSPTYFLIVGNILNESFISAFIYMLAYVLGLGIMLGLIALLGNKLISKLKWAVNPNGVFRKSLGVILLVFGLLIATGIIKEVEAFLLQNNQFNLELIRLEGELIG